MQLQIIKAFNVDIFKFNVLQSVVSLPNIVTCILAGFLIDFIGLPTSSIIFTAFTIVGTAIFAISPMVEDFDLALIGRAIFGIGSECQFIWFNCLASIWFFYAEGSTASGAGQMFGRLGGFLSGVLTPKIFEYYGKVEYTFWAAFGLNLVSIPLILIINYYDRENMKRRRQFHYIH